MTTIHTNIHHSIVHSIEPILRLAENAEKWKHTVQYQHRPKCKNILLQQHTRHFTRTWTLQTVTSQFRVHKLLSIQMWQHASWVKGNVLEEATTMNMEAAESSITFGPIYSTTHKFHISSDELLIFTRYQNIWDSYGDNYNKSCLLGCDNVYWA
jgi:hypothetical protein